TGTYSARIVFEIVPGLRLNLSASFTDPEILILSNFSSNNVNGNTEIKINNPDILKLSASRRVECFESFLGDVDDDPIGDPGGEGGDDAIDGGGTAGEPDNCSATGCSDIIGDYISSGFVISDLFGEQAFVNNLCNSITVEDDEMENDVIINNGANIPVWATTIFNPTDCTCRATGSGTGSAAGFNNVLVEMDLSFNLQNGTFEGEASYNGSTGSQFPAVGYMCDGKKIMFEN
ncbi:MAG: hypothetical protein GTO02_17700, partial [Candidatus Dadabacteria bacterium]|nr:hypothetical protein [Candidatus Dadabacteria bacterium]NIQ16152.1 hypothetical protein [Candidatus Dadabacteria bacterium]